MSRPLIDLIDNLDDIDNFHVANKDTEFYYCWLNKNPDNLQKMKDIWGYEILGAKHTESALVPPSPTGERVFGDVVLARMPRERYERIMQLKKRRTESREFTANEQWKQETNKAGLAVEDDTDISTQEITIGGRRQRR